MLTGTSASSGTDLSTRRRRMITNATAPPMSRQTSAPMISQATGCPAAMAVPDPTGTVTAPVCPGSAIV